MWNRNMPLFHSKLRNEMCLAGKNINIMPFEIGEAVFIQSGGRGIGGYVGDIWNTMADILNFSLNVNDVSNLSLGVAQENGKWTGLLGELQNGHVHVIPQLVMENNRRNVADFTQPFATLGVQMVVKSQVTSHFSWLWYLTPFPATMWQTVLAFLLLISVTLYLSLQTVHKFFPQGKQPKPDFFSNFIYVYGFFCCQGSAPCSNLTSIKIMMHWTSLLAYVLLQAYEDTLMSHIAAVTSWESPFNNLEGLLQSKYSLAVVSGTDIHHELENSKGDVYDAVWKNAVKVVNTDQQAFREVCSGHVAAFVTSEIRAAINCTVTPVSDQYFSSWGSSGLVKGFPCKELIDSTILRLHETGILNILMIRHPSPFWKRQKKRHNPSNSFEGGVQLLQVVPVLSLYAVGIILALVVLMLESAIAVQTSACSCNIMSRCLQHSQSRPQWNM